MPLEVMEIAGFGSGAMVSLLMLKEVSSFLKDRKNGKNHQSHQHDLTDKLDDLSRQIENLYDWHNVRDQDGVPVWYFKRSLEDTLDKLSDSITKQTLAMERIALRMEAMDQKLYTMANV